MLKRSTANPRAASGLQGLLRRDRAAIVAALAGLTILAWIYLFAAAFKMDSTASSAMMQIRPWTALDGLLMFLMWAVMMVGMMVPSAAPMTLIYAAVARKAAREGTLLAPTAIFVGGYVAMWSLFSAGATAAQWGLESRALLSPMMVTTSPFLGAGILIVAGLYQLTPIKDVCLRNCRAPARFLSERWRPGALGAFRMGLEHGAFCLGCCWMLMGLLFFGGVMNLLWIAGLTLFVLLEKVAPHGLLAGRAAGFALIIAGVVSLVGVLGT